MKNTNPDTNSDELSLLPALIRAYIKDGAYEACMEPICSAMVRHPDAPQPHNLMGIVLEKCGKHAAAMKHFRAAWALDPSYRPASRNMRVFSALCPDSRCAFDESDLTDSPHSTIRIIVDERGVGRMVNRWSFEYDKRGVGHAVRR